MTLKMDENENVQSLDSVEVLKNEQALSIIAKSEIESQVATARKFPRSYKAFLQKAETLATLTQDIADSCGYAVKRGDKTLYGPSVRLAEIVVGAYGNIRAGMRVIHNDGITVTAQGVAHDLETNTCVTLEVKRSILQNEWIDDPTRPGKQKKSGKKITMSEDMQVVTGNAACAIAFRNVVFKVVPSALIDTIYEATKKVARGSQATLPQRRQKALDYLYSLGIKDDQICFALEIRSVDDIDLDKLTILRGLVSAIKNQEATIADVFPKPEPKTGKEKADKATQATADAIKEAGNKAAGKKGGDMPV